MKKQRESLSAINPEIDYPYTSLSLTTSVPPVYSILDRKTILRSPSLNETVMSISSLWERKDGHVSKVEVGR